MLTAIKRRTQKVFALIDKYNQLLSTISKDIPLVHLKPISKNELNQLLPNDDFWELEMLTCKEKWVDVRVRKAIIAMHCFDRAEEEIELVAQEARIYSEWAVSRLDDAERVLSLGVSIDSEIGRRVIIIALKAAGVLKAMTTNVNKCLMLTLPEEIKNSLKGFSFSSCKLILSYYQYCKCKTSAMDGENCYVASQYSWCGIRDNR
jgi:hypothetical protein